MDCMNRKGITYAKRSVSHPLPVKAAPPSMKTLKNLLVHLEKCSLEIALNEYQLSALLVGLKRAYKLKELNLSMREISSPKVNPNQWLVTCAEVVKLVSTHPHLVKVDVKNTHYSGSFDDYRIVLLLMAVAIGAIKNKNVTQLGLGGFEICAEPLRLGLPLADHITSIRAEYCTIMYYYDGDNDDAWSKDVIAGPMARHTCSLRLNYVHSASLGLLLSRVNAATKLKDLSLEFFGSPEEDFNLVDVRAVETAFLNCNLHKLRITFEGVSDHCQLQAAILNGLAANTTTQVDSCIYGNYYRVGEITRHLSQQALQRFEVVKTGGCQFLIISRDPSCPSVPAPGPLLNTPSQPTSPKPVATPPETPKPVATPPDPSPSIYVQCPAGPPAPRTGMEEKIARSLDIHGVSQYREGLIGEMQMLGSVLGIEKDTKAIMNRNGSVNDHLLGILSLYIAVKTPTWQDFCTALKSSDCFNNVRAKIEADHNK